MKRFYLSISLSVCAIVVGLLAWRAQRSPSGVPSTLAAAWTPETPEPVLLSAAAGSDRLPADSAQKVAASAPRVELRSALTGALVPNARCVIWEPPAYEPRRFDSSDGIVDVAKEGLHLIHVEADGYCSVEQPIEVLGTSELRLAPTASVRVSCVDEFGQPVNGLVVALAPESAEDEDPRKSHAIVVQRAQVVGDHKARFEEASAGPERAVQLASWMHWAGSSSTFDHIDPNALHATSLEWRAETDALGVALFASVPASSRYRWMVLDAVRASVTPRHEVEAAVETAEGVALNEDPPINVSGVLCLSSGATLDVSAVVFRGTYVSGFVSPGGPFELRSVRVRLFRRSVVESVSAALLHYDEDERADFRVDEDGHFEALVDPGVKLVVVQWDGLDGDVAIASRQVLVRSGEYNDAGIFAVDRQAPLEFKLSLRDAEDGTVVQPESVYLSPDAVLVNVQLVSHASSLDDPRHGVCEFAARPGTSNRLWGLHSAQWTATATDGPDAADMRAGFSRVKAWSRHEFEFPVSNVELVEHVVRSSLVTVRADKTTGDPDRISATLLPLSPAAQKSGALDFELADGGDGTWLGTARVPVGSYELLVRPHAMDVSGSNRFAWLQVNVRAEGPEDIPVRLENGVEVSGLVRDRSGRPAGGAWLNLALAGWSAQCYRAQTDQDGRFVLHGVPPGAELFDAGGRSSLRAPDAVAARALAPISSGNVDRAK